MMRLQILRALYLQVKWCVMKEKKMTEDKSSAATVRTSSVGWMMKAISAHLDREMTSKLKPLNINLGQFAILMTLIEDNGLTQSDIGKKVSMPGYATTRNLDALEQEGLLTRHQHESSRRAHRIRLTESGLALAPQLFKIVREVNRAALEMLSEEDVLQLSAILKKMLPQPYAG